jgi:short subunit dehydrogenase-like uncharacterized protein
MAEREFQYIIYGASGFTGYLFCILMCYYFYDFLGQYVVERLALSLKGNSSVKWAVAGRNGTKIAEFMADSSKRIGALSPHLFFHSLIICF